MLTLAERVVATAAAVVTCAGLVATSTTGAPRATPRAAAEVAAVAPVMPAPAAVALAPPTTPAPAVPAPAPATTSVAPRPAAPAAPAGPLPAPPEVPQQGCPPPPLPPGSGASSQPPPAVPDDALPAPLPPGAKAASLSVVSDRGIWVTNWAATPLDVPALVAKARAAGLHSIWVRTGGTRQGYYGQTVLPALVPAAHAAGIRVVAWDFPAMSDPVADALRAQQAFAGGVDAFAPDVETAAEGTYATPQRITLYLSLVRSYAGRRPIAATVPRPTTWRLQNFPYAAFQPYADAFVPMIYWSCNEPGALVAQSLQTIGRILPVHVVGQGYDMGPEGGRSGLPTFAETWRFLDAARRGGAVGASLWTVEHVGPDQWHALADYPWRSVHP